MKSFLVVTITCPDRPGIVERVTDVVVAHGGNWEESRLARLGGDFAGIAMVSVPSERADELTGGDPVISEHIGDIHLLLGDRERALDRFEEAAALGVREDEQPHLLEKLENLRRELR